MATVSQMKTIDELEGAQAAGAWLQEMVEKYRLRAGYPEAEITRESGVLTLWRRGLPICIAVLQRDQSNWTLTTMIDTEPDTNEESFLDNCRAASRR